MKRYRYGNFYDHYRLDVLNIPRPQLQPKPEAEKKETFWGTLKEIRDLLKQLVANKK
jgi:hypothetical protein